MKAFIGYFDLLGFKEFVQKNDHETQSRGMYNLFRDIGNAAANRKVKKLPNGGFVPDLTDSEVRVLNFSDTVIFWTNEDSFKALSEILSVVFFFNYTSTIHFFPARGTLIHGEIEHVHYNQENENGGAYFLNSVFGTGIVEAYQKSELAEWSGATIDSSVIDRIRFFEKKEAKVLSNYAKLYHVPYKNDKSKNEFAFKLIQEPINKETYLNLEESIRHNFKNYNKTVDAEAVQRKLRNTLEFLKSSIK